MRPETIQRFEELNKEGVVPSTLAHLEQIEKLKSLLPLGTFKGFDQVEKVMVLFEEYQDIFMLRSRRDQVL